MKRTATFVLTLALLTVGCAAPLTVEEYGQRFCQPQPEIDLDAEPEPSTLEDDLAIIKSIIKYRTDVTPPRELREPHEAIVKLLEAWLRWYEITPDASDPNMTWLGTRESLPYFEAVSEAWEAVPDDARESLSQQGCEFVD